MDHLAPCSWDSVSGLFRPGVWGYAPIKFGKIEALVLAVLSCLKHKVSQICSFDKYISPNVTTKKP